ncbi:substrate-binding domain-containing protein [Thermoclostridium stercorarium]|uniref:substrate-binding domain-containing protein n=1 Tax=Thermoclostridium stercorarium TaxID=1510 RepID=UPI000B29C16C|nr:substrate-binding domain-containing protein [Thermoclostridium stercorarium]
MNIDLYLKITQMGIPMVFIDSFYPELSVPYVALDDVKAGYVATEYLIKMGHRNISGVFPHSNRQAHLRYLGYVKALTDYGIQMYDERICWYSKENMTQILYGKPLLDSLKNSTAVFCYNDVTAMMLIDFVRKNGIRVPDDLSVVGVDNSELAKFANLTSVAHPAEQLGEAAAKLMLDMIKRNVEGRNILFPPRLVERGSVKRLENV